MRPFSLLIKPSGPDCNLACKHCFYSCKADIFGHGTHRMSSEVLEKMIRDYLNLRLPLSSFCWQGGEPMLMGLDFFRRAVELQQKYGAPGQSLSNSLQTNATLLDDNWCEFLREYNFLVGISLEGPQDFHDHYRVNHAGRGSFDDVMRAVSLCKQHNVEFNILTLLTDRNVNDPEKIYNFFLAQNIKYLQFIPCAEKDDNGIASYSITAEQYGTFLCRLFDLWLANNGPRTVSIRTFDSVMQYLLNGSHSICIFAKRCNDYIVIEHNGNAYCCDFFVDEAHCLGNIADVPMDGLVSGKIKRSFSEQKTEVPNQCLVCRHFDICRGGCIKERLLTSADHNYFCQSYKMFFDYAVPKFMQLLPDIVNFNRS